VRSFRRGRFVGRLASALAARHLDLHPAQCSQQ
jgi:hypothetical protein